MVGLRLNALSHFGSDYEDFVNLFVKHLSHRSLIKRTSLQRPPS